MCFRTQKPGDLRTAVRSAETPTKFDHFCSTCWRSEEQLERRGAHNSHGTLKDRATSQATGGGGGGSSAAAATGNSKGKGPAARHPSPAAVARAFREKFPQVPICTPEEGVEARARAAMHPTAATTAMSRAATDGGADMGELLREAAMAAFATIHVAVALYIIVFVMCPPQVKVNGGEVGVRTICPSCLTNEFVETPGVSRNGFPSVSRQKIRVAHDIHGVVVPVFGEVSV
ncbi:unnamed protein product [Ectocarpus sp. 6 AP-2014]